MKKGYSIVITSTDSAHTRYFFISRKWFRILFFVLLIIAGVVLVTVISYSRIYYQALETVILKRRNLEIEKEFEKLQEIKENLRIAEMDNRKLKMMLGIEQMPEEVEPVVKDAAADYTEKVEAAADEGKNIPSLLPTMGQISRTFTPEHSGVDIAAPRFSPVVAVAGGVINAAGWDSTYGNYVLIEHNAHYSTFYGHLNSIVVKKHDRVTGGQIIGTVGSTGKSTSPHLHYEVRFDKKSVDPMGYLPFVVKFKE